MQNHIVLEAKELRKKYGQGESEVRALDGINLTINSGEFVAIVGTSGSGKSTLLNMLGGLDNPSTGSVVIDGTEISTLSDEHLPYFGGDALASFFKIIT